ncbi:MAG TPA: 2-amino-4-hydroxy-6-hydroxymethyldihydropteridine diphosphokinase [Bacteroidia bacterium]|jgi:deoxyguanosine kinase|nr:2-amino-4-hydroxy-6-hydroxymethyldihydropteridine diphosphokinase [Bacteroidia bacterium]
MNRVFLSLGSNRGNRQEYLQTATNVLEKRVGNLLQVSHIYETEPWKMNDGTNFLNQVILLETSLDAQEIMALIIETETSLGRIRSTSGYEPRTIDIDILFFNEEVIKSPSVTVPHPLISERRFILEPLCELAPNYIHPKLKKSLKQLLADCPDKHTIARFMSK